MKNNIIKMEGALHVLSLKSQSRLSMSKLDRERHNMTHGVEFRPRQHPPTEPGWYYASWNGDGHVFPVNVTKQFNDFSLLAELNVDRHIHYYHLTAFAWYGPIPKVEEASVCTHP